MRAEQWKELCAGEPGGPGLPAPGVRRGDEAAPGAAADQRGPAGAEEAGRARYDVRPCIQRWMLCFSYCV